MWFQKKIEVPGETIYEIVTAADNALGFGVAAADIAVSKRHKHSVTDELYVLLEGKLRITTGAEGSSRDIYLEKPGTTCFIARGRAHHAESLGTKPARVLVISLPAWTPEDHHLV